MPKTSARNVRWCAGLLFLTVAGCGAGDDEGGVAETAAPGPETPSVTSQFTPRQPMPEVTGENQVGARLYQYRIELTADTVPAGEVEFHVVNAGTTEHMLMVRSETVFASTAHLEPGETAVLRVDIPPGEHTVICIVRDEYDHPSEGMIRRIVAR
jgi:hypothetical protein